MNDKIKFFLVLSMLLALVIKTQAQTTVKVTYNTPGGHYSLSVPDGVSMKIEAWGGGGGGGVGAGDATKGGYGGGGGGGGYVYKNIISNNTTLSVLVATGGKGGDYGFANNQSGFHGSSSLVEWMPSVSCTAFGGQGGEGVFQNDGYGGSSGGYSGGDGGAYGVNGTGKISNCGGAGGNSGNNGGAGGTSQCSNADGNMGNSAGGGGGGGRMETVSSAGGYNGGDGARGEVWITLSFPTPAITSSVTQICSGSNVVLTVSNPVSGVIYVWYRDGISVGSGSSHTASQIGTYTVKAEYPIVCSGGYPIFLPVLGIDNVIVTPASNAIVLTAAPLLQLNPITLNGCSGDNFSMMPLNGTHGNMPAGTNYTWTVASNTGVNGATSNSISSTTLSLGTLTNTTNTQQTVTYDVSPYGGGCTGSNFQVTVQVKPFPQINNIVKTVCNGENANIIPFDGTDGIIPNGTTYSWTIVSNNGVTGATNNIAGNASTLSLGTLTNTALMQKTVIYNVSSLSGACTGSNFQVTVHVEPAINVLLIGDNNVYCTGSSVNLTALTVPTDNYLYDWYLDGGLVTPNYINTYTSTGLSPRFIDYNYHVVARSAIGCEGISSTFAITVKAPPTVNATVNHTDICPNGSITATVNCTPTEPYHYKWFFDNVESGYLQQFTLANLSIGTHYIYVKTTPAAAYNGCEVSSAPIILTVHPQPVVSITADDALICAGEEAILRLNNVMLNTKVKNEHHYTWQWTFDGVAVNNAVQDIHKQILTKAGNYTFSLKMVQNDNLGCVSDWSAPVTVTVEELPQVVLSSDNDMYCRGKNAVLTAATTPFANYIYDWYLDNTFVITNNDTLVSQEVVRVAPYAYHVIAHSANGCEGKSNNVHIMVKDMPSVTLTSNYTDICPSGTITANATAIPADAYLYKWHLNNAEVGTQQQVTLSNLPLGQNTIRVEIAPVASYTGCNVSSTPLTITVHPHPVATITANNTVLCNKGTVLLTSNITLDNQVRNDNNFVYQWEINRNSINSAGQSSYSQILESGVYEFTMRVRQNDDLGCISKWSNPVMITVSHSEVPSFITTDCGEENVAAQGYRIVNIPIDIQAGNPSNYVITFVNPAYSSFAYSGSIKNTYPLGTYIEAHLPLHAGDYDLIVDIEGCKYTTVVRVLVDENAMNGARLIEQRWSDVLTVNNNPSTNGGFLFYSYQWYKNDALIPDAVKQAYTEKGGKLNGKYHVVLQGYAILANNDTVAVSYTSCPVVPTPEFSVAIYPVPVEKNQSLKFSTSLSAEDLTNAVLEIYDVMGVLRRQINTVSSDMSMEGFEHGAYFGRLKTQNNGTHNFRFVVLQ